MSALTSFHGSAHCTARFSSSSSSTVIPKVSSSPAPGSKSRQWLVVPGVAASSRAGHPAASRKVGASQEEMSLPPTIRLSLPAAEK